MLGRKRGRSVSSSTSDMRIRDPFSIPLAALTNIISGSSQGRAWVKISRR